MRFEWDENKRHNNFQKHGLDFADAAELFSGPRLAMIDTRFDYGEDRWVTIGFVASRVVVLVYTEDDVNQVVRIISMGKALSHERKQFEQYI